MNPRSQARSGIPIPYPLENYGGQGIGSGLRRVPTPRICVGGI